MFQKGQIVKNSFGCQHEIINVYRGFMLVKSLSKYIASDSSCFEFYTLKGEFICRASIAPRAVLFSLRTKLRVVSESLSLTSV